MKKINALLHDVTIVDFALIAKLAVRYKKISIITICSGILLSNYFYFSQPTIYSKKVFFKVYSQDDSSISNKKLSDVVGEMANTFLSQGEMSAIISSYDFTYQLAEKLVQSENFHLYDFNSVNNKNYLSHKEMFKGSVTVEDKVKRLRDYLPSLFNLEPELGTSRFILTVSTRSSITTLDFVNKFREVLYLIRQKSAVEKFDKQIEQAQKLIEVSRSGLDKKGGFSQLAPIQSLDVLISLQNDKIKLLMQRLNSQLEDNSFQEIRLKESEITAKKDIDSKNMLDYENYSKISKRVDHLRRNIASMNSVPVESRSNTDKLILEQLVQELKDAEKELTKIGSVRKNISSEDKFIEKQISNQDSFMFDYRVSSEKVRKLQNEVSHAKRDLDELFKKKAKLENDNITLKPDLEYLKQLENKLVSLKLLKSTAKADVSFDHYGIEVSSFKRSSLMQIILFSFVIVTFVLFTLLLLVYLFDDRIHDEFEIERCYDNLEVIGVAPNYTKD